ncbi:MAG: phosphate/phosphite/phosphonate ABC transporter substrate-binding protein [Bdellovibrio sp. CG10_big_fil_rev_8_21_14_0_10_47_8]|nr:MAG: phosphate/phosphite/phosphonate ABC transporter substrate-binding protein [Bdellovibrio sp. CG10_big_fil_rev_8_21_14_0_10_47_8]
MNLWKKFFSIFTLAMILLMQLGCTRNKAPLGSAENPIKFFLVPSVDAKLLEDAGKTLKSVLEEKTPYKYKFAIPSSFVAVVEAFGTQRADVAAINTFGYIMANEKYGVQARITFVRYGSESYQSQILARSDSQIKSLKDLAGKKFAYVDPASTSGYLMPAKLLMDQKIKPVETVFAQKHDNVITMIYQKQVDAGATFYSPPEDGKMQDARRLVKTQFPDVEQKIKILTLTDPIPNDPIVFRKEMSEEMKKNIVQALMDYQKTEEGKKTFYSIYGVTGMVASSDERYDSVREMLKSLGKTAAELSKK